MSDSKNDKLFSIDEIIAACENIGYDLSCGACAELFFTGACFHDHEDNCKTGWRMLYHISDK